MEWQGSGSNRGMGSFDFRHYNETQYSTAWPAYNLRMTFKEEPQGSSWDTVSPDALGWRKGTFLPLRITRYGHSAEDVAATQYMQKELLFVEDSQ